ncbi:hypothetical protein [Streptomyces sp. YS415]|uniref:hypothetical protein n=1 Tax=Streptomyces sp. YS415 TaxID=2944806 RepID=UPI0020221D12|nr:hypothetical protein [Streptomyces sp. YS415]MCL7424615.1 hypothetical protein [Streptomyces sp. YS415]
MTTPPAITGTPRRTPEKEAADGTWQAVRDMRRAPTERSMSGVTAPRDGSGASAPRTTNPAPSVTGEQASDGTRQALPDMSRIPAEREAHA